MKWLLLSFVLLSGIGMARAQDFLLLGVGSGSTGSGGGGGGACASGGLDYSVNGCGLTFYMVGMR